MSESRAVVKQYNNYFSAKNQLSIERKTITAKVGKQKLRARDLNILARKEWLNDNVIDVMTQVLAGQADTELTRKVAVFDTQLTKLILEMPEESASWIYVYEKGVGYAEKRLLGKSPLHFDCILFPNGINRNHWTIMAVFPKQRLIVCLDSLTWGSIQDATTIFTEIKYKHPADAQTLVQPYQQDLGWKFTMDTELSMGQKSVFTGRHRG
jgi:Ulp1 family protease